MPLVDTFQTFSTVCMYRPVFAAFRGGGRFGPADETLQYNY